MSDDTTVKTLKCRVKREGKEPVIMELPDTDAARRALDIVQHRGLESGVIELLPSGSDLSPTEIGTLIHEKAERVLMGEQEKQTPGAVNALLATAGALQASHQGSVAQRIDEQVHEALELIRNAKKENGYSSRPVKWGYVVAKLRQRPFRCLQHEVNQHPCVKQKRHKGKTYYFWSE